MKKKSTFFLLLLAVFVSCKDDEIKEPKRLIEKGVMVDIMYDLTLLEASKYQSLAFSDSLKINSTEFVFKKYKIDSLQFAQNNTFYATDYKEYKNMVETISKRLEKEKKEVDALIKADSKKAILKKKAMIKLLKTKEKAKKDSLNKKVKVKLIKASDTLKKK